MKTNRIIISLSVLLAWSLGINGQESTHWQFDSHGFEKDMAVYFSLEKDGVTITDYSDYEVAAFVDDECRGIASVLSMTDASETEVKCGYLRVRSNNEKDETISIKVYQKSTSKTLYVKETLLFKSNDLLGMPSDPLTFTLMDVLMGDVNGDGKVNSVDLSLMIDRILQKEGITFIDAAGDLNFDGKINSLDFSMLIDLILKIS